jgi:outer membrane immunogenic protein
MLLSSLVLTVSGKNMKKHLFLLAFAASALLPAATALAADLDPPPPPPPVEELRPASYDWTGAYVGGWVGAACIDGTLHDNTQAAVVGGTLPFDFLNAGCGFKGGVVGGYNHQIDDIVLGVEADWGMSNAIVNNDMIGAKYTYTLDGIATVRARAGFAFDDTLLFVTAGGAWARGDIYDTTGTVGHLKADHFGWTIGGGIEHAVTDSLRIRMDYLYTKLNDKNYSTPCATCDLDLGWGDEHEVRLGAVWAF